MDKDIDARYERLEKALGAMIDSLAKNHPSERLAEELVAAQNELYEGLKTLEQHQKNHAKLQELRQQTSLLDTQIKDTHTALWNMRKELKAVPISSDVQLGAKYPFTTAELLGFARRISRNTLPRPGVTNGVDMTPATPQATTQPEPDDSFRIQTQPSQQTPNTSFNLSFNNGMVSTPGPVSAPTPTPNASTLIGGETQQTITTPLPSQQPHQNRPRPATESKLPTHLKPAVNPLHDATFHPWPTEDVIRSGGLAAIQRLVDRGIDPRGYDPEEAERQKKAEEQAKKEAEERARQEREEAERRMREERERMARERERARQLDTAGGPERRDSVGVGFGGARQQGARPKQFTFLGGDDDEDEDEDD
ncbi:hypothetical protein VTI74DRAFT_7514 [Chaetomium olivicolor]